METKRRIIMKRIDGVPVNHRYEPVRDISTAARFPTIEDYNTFINGYYKPTDPSKYIPQEIEITYREVTSNGESDKPIQED